MWKKISISSKKQIIIILLIFIIPSIIFLGSYSFVTMRVLNTRVYETNKNTVYLYQKTLENDLIKIEKFMVDLAANDSDYSQLIFEANKLDAYVASDNIIKKYETIINVYPVIGGMFIYSEANQLFRKVYNEGYPYKIKVALEENIRNKMKNGGRDIPQGWYVEKIENQYFLFRILGIRGTRTICTIKLDNIKNLQDVNSNTEGFVLYSSFTGKPLTMIEKVKEEGIHLKSVSSSFYISGEKKKYFIVQNRLDYIGVNMVYLMPYHGLIFNMDKAQVLLIIASILILLLIPVCYRLLQYSYFRPLGQIVETMNKIKAGKLDSKMRDDYNISEFKQVSNTFNEMMEQIKSLKIAGYEKELESQRAQLQYLQIQIRPHFFLNCLKNLYGMAEEDKSKEIQEVILALSAHCRYMFRDNFVIIPLRNELESVNNYIKLQQMSTSYQTLCNIDVSPELLDFEIPPMSILTFVENSVKHGTCLDNTLKIYIKGRLLKSEEGKCINITISDNGKGFSNERLEKLNKDERNDYTGQHVGIYNVKHRLSLIYENQSNISFSNQANGACVEIFIPYDSKC